MTTDIQATDTTGWQETPPVSPLLRHWTGEAIAKQTWLDKLADPLQNWVRSLPPGTRKIKDILHGTWLGHPVHPTVTDVPIGSWTSTLLLDGIWLGTENAGMAGAADATLVLGLLGSGVAAVTGLTDWSETDATDRRVGLTHGLLNTGILTMQLVSFGLRRSGKRRAGIALSGLSYALTIFSAYLGGELSYAKGIGVNHVAWEGGSDDFVPVMNINDLTEKQLTRVDAAGIPVVLWKENKQIYALAATCSHQGGPLDEGECKNGMISCPWHGSTFRLDNGAVASGPAVYAQPTFDVRVRAGKLELRRREHA